MTTGMLTLVLTLGVGATPPDVYTMRNPNLEIPIRVNDAKRTEIKELELHVSTDQGRTWTLAGRARPEQQAFGFRASGDGLYWFSVCAIDKAGRRDPEDIATAKPALKVLIDTTHAALQVVSVDRVGEEVQVAWECSDSQADAASLKLEYRPAGAEPTAVWTPVAVPSQLIGSYRFRPTNGGAITVRMQITDGAGSPATVVKDVPAAAPPPSATAFAGPAAAPLMSPAPQAVAPPPGIQQANSMAAQSPPPVAPLGQMPSMVAPQPSPSEPTTIPAAPPAPAVVTNPEPVPAAGAMAPLRSAAEPARPVAPSPTVDAAGQTAPTPSPDVQHVRDRSVAIDFDVDRKGPSGVKKVEVYVTQDEGHTWYKYTESLNANPPLQLDLPAKDGVYGFHLVLFSGVGQSEGPPKPDTPPQFKLLVDRTAPAVVMYNPVLDANQPNCLLLRYKAEDANLARDSVALFWRSRPDQPWQPIASGSRRTMEKDVEEFAWTITPDVPNSVYLRLTAKDQAGNVGEFVTRDPVTVDLNKPVAKFKGIVSASYRRP